MIEFHCSYWNFNALFHLNWSARFYSQRNLLFRFFFSFDAIEKCVQMPIRIVYHWKQWLLSFYPPLSSSLCARLFRCVVCMSVFARILTCQIEISYLYSMIISLSLSCCVYSSFILSCEFLFFFFIFVRLSNGVNNSLLNMNLEFILTVIWRQLTFLLVFLFYSFSFSFSFVSVIW